MAALNFSQAPFLTYLTVFKARLGAMNLVLAKVNLGFSHVATLERKLKAELLEKVDVDLTDPSEVAFVLYLRAKKLLGAHTKKRGRYANWTWEKSGGYVVAHRGVPTSIFSAYQVDRWFADERLPSTIGVPTPENVHELVELAQQLRLIHRAKCSLTAAGQLTLVLRSLSLEAHPESNPFVLGLEGIGYLRQLVSEDGLMLAEVMRVVAEGPASFSRDDIARELPGAARRAYKRALSMRFSPPALSDAKRFVDLLDVTAGNAAKKMRSQSKGESLRKKAVGPGVLEHRTSPRLEWLCDVGVLHKAGGGKNEFRYQRGPDADLFTRLLLEAYSHALPAEEIAHHYWANAEFYKPIRERMATPEIDQALAHSYRLLQRPVGATPIKEIAFLAMILRASPEDSLAALHARLVDWAKTEKAITLSGGRYSRNPEFVHIAPSFFSEGK